MCYNNGDGVKQDKDRAAREFHKAAAKGHRRAQMFLAEGALRVAYHAFSRLSEVDT